MSTQRTVELSEHFVRFVDDHARDERYGSVRGVLEAGLKLLEQREEDIERLRVAIDKGEASGDYSELDWDQLFEQVEGENLKARTSVA